MNGSSISRKAVGRKPIQQFAEISPLQSSSSPTVLSQPAPILAAAPQYPALIQNTMQPAFVPYHVTPVPPFSPEAVNALPPAAAQTVPQQYPSYTTSMPTHQAATMAPLPQQVPVQTTSVAPPNYSQYPQQQGMMFQGSGQPTVMETNSTAATAVPLQFSHAPALVNSPSSPQTQSSSITPASTPSSAPMTPAMVPNSTTGLQRSETRSSIQSVPSVSSQNTGTWSTSASTQMTPVTPCETPQSAGVNTVMSSCTSCRQAIAQNVSTYTCLVCITGHVTTTVCVWCYTTGAAASSHPHDLSYFATNSDMRVQSPAANISLQVWTVHKNASGRLWYLHNTTGFRTHVQPLTAAIGDDANDTKLPPGWQEVGLPDGRVYYNQTGTSSSTWTRPKVTLPPGWKTVKTPDGKPFYVHETLQLATWVRPGEQPEAESPTPGAAISAGTATSARTATPAGTVVQPGIKRKGSKALNIASTATSVANNVAKLSAASDLTPSGILTATVAAAKLTGIGLKVTGKKMGKLGKLKHLATATNILSTAARLTGDGNYQTVEIEEVDEVDFGDGTEFVDETIVVETSNGGLGGFEGAAITMIDAMAVQPNMQQDILNMQQQIFAGQQQPLYYPNQQGYPLFSAAVDAFTTVPQIQNQIQQIVSPILSKNISSTVEEIVVSSINAQSNQAMENLASVQNMVGPMANMNIQQTAAFTDLSWQQPLVANGNFDNLPLASAPQSRQPEQQPIAAQSASPMPPTEMHSPAAAHPPPQYTAVPVETRGAPV